MAISRLVVEVAREPSYNADTGLRALVVEALGMRFRNSAVDPSRVGSTIFFLLVAFFATESFSQTSQPVPEHPTANQAQGQSDLSEAAEQARMERDRERARRSSNSEAVNEMAGELEDSTQPDPTGAPVGFRFYSFKEGS